MNDESSVTDTEEFVNEKCLIQM